MYKHPPPDYSEPAPAPPDAGGWRAASQPPRAGRDNPDAGATSPLLGGPAAAAFAPPAGGFPEGYPADFSYGVDVKSSSVSVQMDFVRKVYSILFAQLFASAVLGAVMFTSTAFKVWSWNNSWALFLSMIMSFVSLGLLFWKRHSVPTNYGLLVMFTMFESYMIGNAVAFYDSKVVLQAVIITAGVVVALTLFTFQTKWDFSGMGPWLTGILFVLILVMFVQMFFPFNRMFDFFIAIATAIVFVGFILYDTQQLFRMSPDEYIAASVQLYLDVINLFLAILRIVRYLNNDSN